MNQIYKCKIYKHKTYTAQNKYFHKIEDLKLFLHSTYMLFNRLAMLSQMCTFTNTATNRSYSCNQMIKDFTNTDVN